MSEIAAKRRIQAETISTYRAKVEALAKRMVPGPPHVEEATQAGLIGLLIALEKYDPARVAPATTAHSSPFWFFARAYVRNEIQQWISIGVFWRKDGNRGKNEAAKRQRAAIAATKVFSADAPKAVGDVESWIDAFHDADQLSTEELCADAESARRLQVFAATLSKADAEKLLTEHGRSKESVHYLSLVERASAFVRGTDEYRDSVSGHSDPARPVSAPPAGRA
jgi:hypothetical protein